MFFLRRDDRSLRVYYVGCELARVRLRVPKGPENWSRKSMPDRVLRDAGCVRLFPLVARIPTRMSATFMWAGTGLAGSILKLAPSGSGAARPATAERSSFLATAERSTYLF